MTKVQCSECSGDGRKALNIDCDVEVPDYYAIHEYYPSEDGDGWTEDPVFVDGDSVEEVKRVLQMMLEDIEKHGVKDYE